MQQLENPEIRAEYQQGELSGHDGAEIFSWKSGNDNAPYCGVSNGGTTANRPYTPGERVVARIESVT